MWSQTQAPVLCCLQTEEEKVAARLSILCFQCVEWEQPTGHAGFLFGPCSPICMGITAKNIKQKQILLLSTQADKTIC